MSYPDINWLLLSTLYQGISIVIKDLSTKVADIQHNVLNLLGRIHFENGNTTTYTSIGASEQQTFTWYMPRNARGTITNSEQKAKNEIAPGKASYIEIYAVNKDKENEGRYFRIFPGANLVNDF